MNFETIDLAGNAAMFERDVRDLLVQILPLMSGKRVAVGLDALLSAYITTLSQSATDGANKHAAACLRKTADLLEAGAFDRSPTSAGNAVH